jgi:hypothetical protein
MAVELYEQNSGKVLTLKIKDKLSKDDYKIFAPRVETLIEQHDKIRLMVEMSDFHGWDAGALWEDIKFDAKHFSDIERIAFVGDKKWEKGMSVFCKPFTTAKIKYFDRSEKEQASDWIQEGIPVTS